MAAMAASSPSEERKILITEEWSDAANTIAAAAASSSSSPVIALICGPKNSGKSTFSRHLLNLLLDKHEKVAYLDTDVGQPEFTPPGLLSLLLIDQITPDLTKSRLETPDRCFFFGDISSKRDPELYFNCISSLYNHYLKEYHLNRMPLVINTPGWVKGIGLHILVQMLNHMSPTHVVKIQRSVESKNLPTGAFWLSNGNANSVNVLEINSALRGYNNESVLLRKESSRLRELLILSYFQQCLPSEQPTNKELARALAALPSYEVSISSVKIKHLHCQVPVSETFYVLNASIVGLAISSVSEQLPLCVGLGIVRAIDTSKGVLYVITPVPLQTLEDVDLLLQGFIQLPTSLLQVQGCVSPYMCANVLSL